MGTCPKILTPYYIFVDNERKVFIYTPQCVKLITKAGDLLVIKMQDKI